MDAFNLPAPQAAPPVDRLQRLQRWRWNELREKMAYRYFCWRFGPLSRSLPIHYAQTCSTCGPLAAVGKERAALGRWHAAAYAEALCMPLQK